MSLQAQKCHKRFLCCSLKQIKGDNKIRENISLMERVTALSEWRLHAWTVKKKRVSHAAILLCTSFPPEAFHLKLFRLKHFLKHVANMKSRWQPNSIISHFSKKGGQIIRTLSIKNLNKMAKSGCYLSEWSLNTSLHEFLNSYFFGYWLLLLFWLLLFYQQKREVISEEEHVIKLWLKANNFLCNNCTN